MPERSIHDSLMKAIRARIAKHAGIKMLYLYYPQENKGEVLYYRADFLKWVAETTRKITVKPNKNGDKE